MTPIALIHADARLVVVDKPAGLLAVPGIGPENADCLVARLREGLPTAMIVHRLDQATSGVMVLALDAESHRRLSGQFERRTVEKRYIAVVAGVVAEDAGEIDLPMRKDMQRKARHVVDHQRGRPALTRWRVRERDVAARRTSVELAPVTGRSHQLRVHLASIGHPILGDVFYAPPDVADAAPRLMLHATSLAFDHPDDGRRVCFGSVPAWTGMC